MSVDIDWSKITGGPQGAALALKIRDFVDDRFQTMALPRFIKSVKVHDFAFGAISPDVEIKDVTDPLPDFYEENPEADDADAEDEVEDLKEEELSPAEKRRRERMEGGAAAAMGGGRGGGRGGGTGSRGGMPQSRAAAFSSGAAESEQRVPGFPGPSSPLSPTLGVPGGTSNMHYFHLHPHHHHWSGTQTPLAAVAGAAGPSPFNTPSPGLGSMSPPPRPRPPPIPINIPQRRLGHSRQPSHSSVASGDVVGSPALAPPPLLNTKGSVSTFAPPSSAGGSTGPPTRDALREAPGGGALAAGSVPSQPAVSSTSGSDSSGEDKRVLDRGADDDDEEDDNNNDDDDEDDNVFSIREPRVEDTQAVFRIKYSGDIHLSLTAELLLDYPMPAFVGIPVHLKITGLSFDGVGVVAKIGRRAHFCFLSPEDAQAYADTPDRGDETAVDDGEKEEDGPIGGLLKEVKVESEIGQSGDGGRQTLRNVGKVERFVLEKVRSIFEDELVYPSFWTFLI